MKSLHTMFVLRFLRWMEKYAGIIIVTSFLLIHLAIINDYGFTWDFHFHFFGGGKLLGIEPQELEPRSLPFVEPDPRRAWTLPYGPIMSIPPVASYVFFNKSLDILPPDSAYHLPIILWGVIGIAVLYVFLNEAFSRRMAILGAILLALMPRYFGDLHNNMKDIPSAVVFALNIWLLWRLVRGGRALDLVAAVIAFAIAFNVKINSIFIPVIFAAWLLSLHVTRSSLRPTRLILWYFAAAPVAAILLWWAFWPDPIGQLKHAFLTFGVGTNNIEVILGGKWYCSGLTVPWYYPWWYLGITTPLPVLLLFFIGLIGFMKHIKPISVLLILWLLIPLTRYLLSAVGVIDGIRHFEEVLFPIAAIAAIGLDSLFSFARPGLAKLSAFFLLLVTIFYLLFTNFSYHPYQITYFNELVDGVTGAFGKYDLDYWGTSQKAAVSWVNENAPQNARVHIVMAAAVAGQYLRPDLIPNLNKYGYDESDFVILLNRQSFLYRFFYAYEYLLHHRPIHTISVQGAPLVWIYDNRTDNTTPRQTPFWQDEDPCIIKYWRGQQP